MVWFGLVSLFNGISIFILYIYIFVYILDWAPMKVKPTNSLSLLPTSLSIIVTFSSWTDSRLLSCFSFIPHNFSLCAMSPTEPYLMVPLQDVVHYGLIDEVDILWSSHFLLEVYSCAALHQRPHIASPFMSIHISPHQSCDCKYYL